MLLVTGPEAKASTGTQRRVMDDLRGTQRRVMDDLRGRNEELRRTAAEGDANTAALERQISSLRNRWQAASDANEEMRTTLVDLRRRLQVVPVCEEIA